MRGHISGNAIENQEVHSNPLGFHRLVGESSIFKSASRMPCLHHFDFSRKSARVLKIRYGEIGIVFINSDFQIQIARKLHDPSYNNTIS